MFDPRQMQAMMKKMGIKSEPLDVKRIIFELDGEEMIFNNPNVTAISAKGQETFQLAGEYERKPTTSEEDISLIMEKTAASREDAIAALKETGDLAEAILKLASA